MRPRKVNMARTNTANDGWEKAKRLKIISGNLYENTPPISKQKIKPAKQFYVTVQNFSGAPPLKGFAIHISPDPDPEAIVAQVTKIGNDKAYELVLLVANYSNKTFEVEVWQL